MRRLLLLVSAIVLVDTMFFAAITPLLPHYADRFGLTKAGAGVLTGSYAAGTLVGAIPSGVLTSRLGVKPTVLIGLALMSAMSIVFGLGTSIWLLDGARFVQGAASALTWTAALSWLVSAVPRERRGELLGVAIGAAVGGALLGPVLGGAASIVGTGPAFGAVAVLGAGLAAWALATPAVPPGERQPLRLFLVAARHPTVATGLWFIALPGLLFGLLGVLAPLHLNALGVGAVGIGAIFLCSAALEAALSPLMGRLSDRRGRLVPIRAGLVSSSALALALPWVDARWPLVGLVLIAGLAFGFFWAPGMALIADGADALGLEHGFGFALMSMAWAPGQAIGSALGGTVAHATSDAVPYLALAGLCLLTLAVVGRRRARPAVPAWESESSS